MARIQPQHKTLVVADINGQYWYQPPSNEIVVVYMATLKTQEIYSVLINPHNKFLNIEQVVVAVGIQDRDDSNIAKTFSIFYVKWKQELT